jgi:hypothetical protein
MTVTCTYKGRMGNQLFGIAAIIAYALEHGIDYLLPDHTETGEPIYITKLPTGTLKGNPMWWKEPADQSYQKPPAPEGQNVVLDGYLQSYKYYQPYRKEVIEALGFPAGHLPGVVGIHVRRGDYLSLPDSFPFVGEDYLRSAVWHMNRIGYRNFKVFSDDLDWCRNFFEELPFEDSDFEYSDNETPQQDLVEGSHCEHLIGSNSTFSYWMAELNENPDKIIVMPGEKTPWFGPKLSHVNTLDLLPPEWIKM